MRNPAGLIAFVAGFGVARVGLFFAPIILANFLPIMDYGRVELVQAISSIVALIIGLGLPATVPLILLRGEVKARWDTLLLLVSSLALGLMAVALLMLANTGVPFSVPVLVPLVTAVLMLQGLWAITLKSHGRGTAAVFLETGFWLTMLAGGLVVRQMAGSTNWIAGSLAIYALVLTGFTLRQYSRHRRAFTLSDITDNLKLGAPLMLTGLLSILLISFQRISLGQVADAATVGLYAILFRATALPLVAHQILVIGFFRQLFSWEDEVLRRRSPIIIWGVGLSILLFWVLVGPLGWLLGQRFVETFAQFGLVGRIILLQTVIWSAIALNDLLNSRLRIAGKVARWTGTYLVLALPTILLALMLLPDKSNPAEVLGLFVPAYATLMAGYFAVQCWAMARQGHVFLSLWGSTLAVLLLGLAALLIWVVL